MSVLEYATPTKSVASKFDLGWFAWAPFLGVSWTWCIGMFLPILLIRDYGDLGYWFFAVPNVLGAAAMGWVIRSRSSSRRIVTNHSAAALAFSIITISFHFYFAAWLVRVLWSPSAVLILIGGSVILTLLVLWVRWSDRAASAIAFIISFILVSKLNEPIRGASAIANLSELPLLGLALVCTLGFVLCPYLDLTFHRARGRVVTREQSRWAFSLGFGLFFLPLIIYTQNYSDPIRFLLKDGFLLGEDYVVSAVSIHLLLQMSVTVAFHAREILASSRGGVRQPVESLWKTRWILPALIACVLAATIAGMQVRSGIVMIGLNQGEVGYRIFMGFYGLIFPAYVWLCMLPGRGKLKPTQRQIVITCIAILVALPMFWLGFIERKTEWLVPGVGVVLLAKLFDRQAPRGSIL